MDIVSGLLDFAWFACLEFAFGCALFALYLKRFPQRRDGSLLEGD